MTERSEYDTNLLGRGDPPVWGVFQILAPDGNVAQHLNKRHPQCQQPKRGSSARIFQPNAEYLLGMWQKTSRFVVHPVIRLK